MKWDPCTSSGLNSGHDATAAAVGDLGGCERLCGVELVALW